MSVPVQLRPKRFLQEQKFKPRFKLSPQQVSKVQQFDVEKHTNWEFLPPVLNVGNAAIAENIDFRSGPVTFDFWDTLIARTRPAESVKLSTALYLAMEIWRQFDYSRPKPRVKDIYESRVRVEEELSRAGDPRLEEVLDILAGQFGQIIDTEDLVNFELQGEIENTRVLKETISISQNLISKPAIVSDHFFSNEALGKILDHHQVRDKFGDIFVSSQFGKTKRDNGKLFDAIPLDLSGHWVHVGDNAWSDGDCSEKKGAKAVLVTRTEITSWNKHHSTFFDLGYDLRDHLVAKEASAFLVELSALCYSINTFAIEECLSKGLTKVVYLSREGETLARAHSILNKNLPDYIPRLDVIHLPCSRSSVFGASFSGNLAGAIVEISKNFPVMNGNTFCRTFGLDEDLSSNVKSQIGTLNDFKTSDVLASLNDELIEQISTYISEQKEIIIELLETSGIDSSNSILCDLGWRGTIQDSLGRLTGSTFQGCYFGLFADVQLSKKDPKTPNKSGLIFDQFKNQQPPSYFNFFGPLERAFTNSKNSVVRYSKQGGLAEPVFSPNTDAPSTGRSCIYEDHFNDTMKLVSSQALIAGIFGEESADFARGVLERWYLSPSSIHSATWFDEVHEEGFGVTDEVHYKIEKPNKEWLTRALELRLDSAARHSLWPEGYRRWSVVANLLESLESINE